MKYQRAGWLLNDVGACSSEGSIHEYYFFPMQQLRDAFEANNSNN